MQLPAISFNMLLLLFVINQVASALIQSMPTPTEGGNQLYAFVYKFLTLLVGDFKSFMSKLPAIGTAQVTLPSGAKTTVATSEVPVSTENAGN